MAKPELTKKLIADTLKKIIIDKPLDKISIGEIVETAGLNRQTFYYHFKDKQDLVCWIFDNDISNLTDANHNNTIIDDVAEYMYSEKKFYVAALSSDSQNSLREHIFNVCYKTLVRRTLYILRKRKMDKKNIEMFAGYFTNALVGSLIKWAQNGMKTDLKDVREDYAVMTNDCLEFVINQYLDKQNISK